MLGHPTWKQIRVGQSQLARHYRKNNLYTHTLDRLADQTDTLNDAGTSFKQSGTRTTLLTTQSVVSDRYYPVVYNLEIRNDQQKSKILKSTDVVVKTSFVNDTVTFDNVEFKNNVIDERQLKRASARTSYKQIINNFSIYDSLLDEEQPILQINKLQYRENRLSTTTVLHTRKKFVEEQITKTTSGVMLEQIEQQRALLKNRQIAKGMLYCKVHGLLMVMNQQ